MKCAILLSSNIPEIDVKRFDLLIGSESGSQIVIKYQDEVNTHHIGDFDSVSNEFREMITSKANTTFMRDEEKSWCDGEEAIIHALKNGYEGSDIEVYVDATKRHDHLINMMMVTRKYNCKLISHKITAITTTPNVEVVINKELDYVTAIFNEETHIKTQGLKWDVDKVFGPESGTNFVSNKVLGKDFKVVTNKKTLIIQSSD